MSVKETPEELQARIRSLQNRINAAKQHNGRQYRTRSSPYTTARRGIAPSHTNAPFRNRTLVVRNEPVASGSDATPSESWVSKREPGQMQLINKTVYDKTAEERVSHVVPVATALPPAGPERLALDRRLTKTPSKTELCRAFTSTGKCRHGSQCKFLHDPSKVAICKQYLANGTCQNGEYCDLSHESTPHRVPPCSFFLRGSCTNDQCRYAHVKVNPHAPTCAAFVTLGYCEEGAKCAKRHEYECPEYSAKGTCPTPQCRLPHIDRAGQLRQRPNVLPATTDGVQAAAGKSLLDSLDKALSGEQTQTQNVGGGMTAKAASRTSTPPTVSNFSQQADFVAIDDDSAGDFEARFQAE